MLRRRSLALVAIVALAACGGDDDSTSSSTGPVDVSLVPMTQPSMAPPPSVELPAEAPADVTKTVLSEGSGPEAIAGDGVLVRYVGVSLETGEEFDSNFGGEPLPVTLGQGGVIPGWEEGLVGVRAGERLQLDLPAEAGYGPTPTAPPETTAPASAPASTQPGPPTGPLSFVIDVLAVVPTVDPANAPTAGEFPTLCGPPFTPPPTTVPGDTTASTDPAVTTETTSDTGSSADTTTGDSSATTAASTETSGATTELSDTTDGTATTATGASVLETGSTTPGPGSTATTPAPIEDCDVNVPEVETLDIVDGEGPTAEPGQTVIVHYILARADNGVILRGSWDDGSPSQLQLIQTDAEMSGMIDGIVGMQVGGRRAITVPYMEAFGETGLPTSGLPASTDVVVVVDLYATYT